MRYTLMNAEHEVIDFDIDLKNRQLNQTGEVKDLRYAPIYFNGSKDIRLSLYSFLSSRTLGSLRRDTNNIIKALSLTNELELSFYSLGLSLTDCYWYRPEGSSLKWQEVSSFERDYDTAMGEAILRCDYEALKKADPLSPDLTLGGISKKAWIKINGAPMLLKSEAGEASIVEQAELLSSRLTERLLDEKDYIAYRHMDFEGESFIACRGMVKKYEEFIPAAHILKNLELPGDYHSFKVISKDKDFLNTFTETLKKMGVENITSYYAKLGAAFDLTLAGDCHSDNFGFIRDLKTLKLRPAPLFDRGRSFGSFGQPIENGEISAAKSAISATKVMFLMLLFNSIVLHPDWDYSWYDPERLEGFHEDIDKYLGGCEDAPEEYRTLLKAAFDYQLDYLNKAAGLK
ncbi:MAG: hypothetical protein IJ740_09975 [Ruminococcus sp.]|nr:hypothetical protein [Ruminococcus sp.]